MADALRIDLKRRRAERWIIVAASVDGRQWDEMLQGGDRLRREGAGDWSPALEDRSCGGRVPFGSSGSLVTPF